MTTIDREGLLLFLGNWFDEYLSFFFFCVEPDCSEVVLVTA